jgi:hypothetical protein
MTSIQKLLPKISCMKIFPRRINTILMEKIQKAGCRYQINARGEDPIA